MGCGPNAKLSTADIVAQLAAASEKPGAVARHDGDAAAAIARAAKKVDAVYEQPFLAHAAMEPMNCTVQMTKDGCDIWVGTQVPGLTQAAVMKVTGLKPRAGPHPQSSARRRIRAPPRVRRNRARRADRPAGDGAGAR